MLRRHSVIEKEVTAELGLKVDRDGNFFRVRWNNNSPLIKSAKRGTLIIKDGALQKEMVLDEDKLHRADLLYPRLSDNVGFSLKVVANGSVTTESLLVFDAPPLPPYPKPDLPVTVAKTFPTSASSRRASVTRGKQRLRLPKIGPAPPEQTRIVSQGSTPGSPQAAIEGPAVTTSNNTPEVGPLPGGDGNRALQPPAPAPARTEAATPVGVRAETPASAQSRDTPVNPTNTTIDYVAARPVRRVAPIVPSSLRSLAISGIRVQIAAHIDAAGKVVGAEPISRGNSLTNHLSSIAADSVRQWLFSPARRGGQNVPSEVVLQFQFSNE
jgi:hypothetical protein